MHDQVVGEQFLLIGNVDIPASSENTMKLLGMLGGKGYLPNIIQEVSFVDGRSQNRLCLTNMVDVSINFNSDRIQIARSTPAGSYTKKQSFEELVSEVCQALIGEFDLDIRRAVLIREKMMHEYPENKMKDICQKFVGYGAEANPFEWLSRTSVMLGENDAKILKIVEVGRAYGFYQGDVLKPFDRIRAKVEAGTDMLNQQLRIDLKQSLVLLGDFEAVISEAYESLENVYHQA